MRPESKLVLNLPEITDVDICWAANHLGLKENAFHGVDGADPRSRVLKSMESLNVAACPGSGKTTLLVAKLAILAENWPHRTRGICVLSHTNQAREVIEAKLGNTKAGRNLLSYPHYIGTIHGFVNEFLALPWLRSLGYSIKVIDTDICQRRRWYGLPRNIRESLGNRHSQNILHISSPDFSVGDIAWGKSGILGKDSKTYQDIISVCRQSAIDGYHCYDEMFVWANNILDKFPTVKETVRSRFPLLFIDEAQDNSEEQSAILQRIFISGDASIIRQRFGDANQAIYDSMNAKAAITDTFPDEKAIDIPNSYRFCQRIANLANPLGLKPVPNGLVGQGPAWPLSPGGKQATHTIFLFGGDNAAKVLDAYAELIMATFSEQELSAENFTATAIGQVHRPNDEEKENQFPRHVSQYWPEYDCELSKSDPRPHTFIQYILAGQALAERKKETFPAVEKIAEAILRLASMGTEKINYQNRRYKHRFVKDLLINYPMSHRFYECMISSFAIEKRTLAKDDWDNCWYEIMLEIAGIIAADNLRGKDVDEFMQWNINTNQTQINMDASAKNDNIYRYPDSNNTKVKIRVGSIHSVKGDEHTATLVLETFWYKHNLDDIFKWFMNGKKAKDCTGDQRRNRMKLHYVAMSRPTHLLCLAMKRKTFENNKGDIDTTLISKVKSMGWDIKFVQ